MQLMAFAVAGGGGRQVFVNPDHVVCLMEAGDGRTQVVTTGLSGEASISLIVEGRPQAVADRLGLAAQPRPVERERREPGPEAGGYGRERATF